MSLDVPEAWRRIDLERLEGLVPIIGGTDVGKSTFARWLFGALSSKGENQSIALLDGDPGQSTLGPPATLTIAFSLDGEDEAQFKDPIRRRRVFVSSTSPRGHLLECLTGVERLVRYAERSGAKAVLYDASGFIDPRAGGLALKWAELELFRPGAVFAIQRVEELEQLLIPLRLSRRVEVHVLRPSHAAHARSKEARRSHRARQFARHFQTARPLPLTWSSLAVLPTPRFHPHQLVGLEDKEGFLLDLGIVLEVEPAPRRVTVLTPLPSFDQVRVLKLGDAFVDPVSYRDASG